MVSRCYTWCDARDFRVPGVATTDESHRIQIVVQVIPAFLCLWESLSTFLKAPVVPCGPTPSTLWLGENSDLFFLQDAYLTELIWCASQFAPLIPMSWHRNVKLNLVYTTGNNYKWNFHRKFLWIWDFGNSSNLSEIHRIWYIYMIHALTSLHNYLGVRSYPHLKLFLKKMNTGTVRILY